jgi:hypothetical protein
VSGATAGDDNQEPEEAELEMKLAGHEAGGAPKGRELWQLSPQNIECWRRPPTGKMASKPQTRAGGIVATDIRIPEPEPECCSGRSGAGCAGRKRPDFAPRPATDRANPVRALSAAPLPTSSPRAAASAPPIAAPEVIPARIICRSVPLMPSARTATAEGAARQKRRRAQRQLGNGSANWS